MPALSLLLPGDPETLTGGYLYDKHMGDGLRELGWRVAVESLDASFPQPSAAALADAAARFAALADGSIALIDGLALPGLADVLHEQHDRLRLIGLVHHSVALETGLAPERVQALAAAEQRALAALHGIVCTSRWTAGLLAKSGHAPERIRIAPPGTRRAPRSRGSGSATPNLLSVATVTPRKGHVMLIEALATLRRSPWHLHCVGSLERDPRCAAHVRAEIAALGLGDRITLHGDVPQARLDALYAAADIFVLASELEGFGMAIAEALVRGLPSVATRGGAIADWVPPDAARLVEPGHAAALAAALAPLIGEPRRRAELAARALTAGRDLPDWPAAAQRLADALHELAAQ